MPYRNDEAAAEARRAEIERELMDVRSRVEAVEAWRSRKAQLETELAGLEKARARFAKARLPLLAKVKVASPCSADWEKMVGDDEVRFCSSCEKNVYNLSALTALEAQALVQEKEGDMCARFYRRADGTMLTADCPSGARKKWVTRAAAATVLFGGAAAALVANDRAHLVGTRTMGKISVDETAQPAEMGSIAEPSMAPPLAPATHDEPR